MPLGNQILVLERHTNVAERNRLMGSKPFHHVIMYLENCLNG
jgi:hypothetical protein